MKAFLAIPLLIAALPAFAQDIGALTADTKKTVLPVVPKVVNAMQEVVAAKAAPGENPIPHPQASWIQS